MKYAYFDIDGICIRVSNSDVIDESIPFCTKADDYVKPNQVYYNLIHREMRESVPVDDVLGLLKLSPIVPVGSAIKVLLPEDCIVEVDGQRFKNKLLIKFDEPSVVHLKLLGAQTGEAIININSYVEDRRTEYPSVQEQLDMLYHLGYDGWKEAITAIKEKYPKPE